MPNIHAAQAPRAPPQPQARPQLPHPRLPEASHLDAQGPQQPHTVPLWELLTPSFLGRHSRFDNLDALLAAGGPAVAGLTSHNPTCVDRWNEFIRGHSAYTGWDAMVRDAGAEWLIRRIGIVIDR